ncbi:MAG: nucleoside hydrolase [Candidatus Limnocylindrales bacterium]
MTDRIPLLIDCDTGIDDSLALVYACASPEAEILAVTCCSGNVAAEQVAENTRAVLELAGRTDIEVAIGRRTPLMRALETTPETHGPRGIGHAVLPPPTRPVSDRHGVDLIVETARRRPDEVTLVTLGPLTNLALALLLEPELPRLLRRVVVMGGAFRVAGNTTPREEWNIHCDPEAARIVFSAFGETSVERLPLVLGLDVTERARFLPDHLVALARRAGSRPDDSLALARGDDPLRAARSVASDPIVRYLADALRFYMEFHARYDGFYGAFVHDPLALAAALDPGLVRTEKVTVDVETRGAVTTGETVADWRHLWGRRPNCEVAVETDADRFLDRFVERVGGLAERLAQA